MLLRHSSFVIFSFVLFPVIMGCQVPYNQYIVLRAVPEYPSFVVIPANDYLDQVAFANEVEAAIIGVGVKVINRPATKEVTKEVAAEGGIQAIEGNQAVRKSGEGKLTEKYVAFEDIDADYTVQTYASSRQIRIMKNQTREILAVLNLSENLYIEQGNKIAYRRKLVADALANIGIPVLYTHKQSSSQNEKRQNTALEKSIR